MHPARFKAIQWLISSLITLWFFFNLVPDIGGPWSRFSTSFRADGSECLLKQFLIEFIILKNTKFEVLQKLEAFAELFPRSRIVVALALSSSHFVLQKINFDTKNNEIISFFSKIIIFGKFLGGGGVEGVGVGVHSVHFTAHERCHFGKSPFRSEQTRIFQKRIPFRKYRFFDRIFASLRLSQSERKYKSGLWL